jgi:hypothetical protein
MFHKLKCSVQGCNYECGVEIDNDKDDNEWVFAKRVQFAKTLRDEHPNHPSNAITIEQIG